MSASGFATEFLSVENSCLLCDLTTHAPGAYIIAENNELL